MPKKAKATKVKAEKKQNGKKENGNQNAEGPSAVDAAATQGAAKARPLLRAIRVSREVLEAAKAYKKDKSISFYKLGLESITERLVKEGYLKEAVEPKV